PLGASSSLAEMGVPRRRWSIYHQGSLDPGGGECLRNHLAAASVWRLHLVPALHSCAELPLCSRGRRPGSDLPGRQQPASSFSGGSTEGPRDRLGRGVRFAASHSAVANSLFHRGEVSRHSILVVLLLRPGPAALAFVLRVRGGHAPGPGNSGTSQAQRAVLAG